MHYRGTGILYEPRHMERSQQYDIISHGLAYHVANICTGLGAGGEESPYLVNAANAVTFGYEQGIFLNM